MSMERATAAFLAICDGCCVTPTEVRERADVTFFLPSGQANGDILHAVANVEDVKADPPNVYTLREEVTPPEGEYAKTHSVYYD
jgi:hypothetical protein